jgi:CHAT domain-containing protein
MTAIRATWRAVALAGSLTMTVTLLNAQAPQSPSAPADDATVLMRQGFLLIGKDPDGAQSRFQACLSSARELLSRTVAADCTRGLGLVAQARRDFEVARAHFDTAHALFVAGDDHAGMARTHNDRALLAYVQARWPDTREFYGRAASEFAIAGMRAEQAAALRSMTFSQSMTFAEIDAVLGEAWQIAVDAKATRVEALVLHHWGDMIFGQGDYATSIEKTERAVALLEQLNDTVSLARALTSMGRLYRAHGAPRLAVDMYERVLALQEKSGDTAGQGQTHTAIATALSLMGDHRRALEHDERALELVSATGRQSQIDFQVAHLAGTLIGSGQYDRAIELLRGVIANDPSSIDVPIHHDRVARALLGLKRYDEALVEASLAVAGAQQHGKQEWQVGLLITRASAREALNQPAEALRDLREAGSVIESVRARLAPTDLMKSGYAEQYQRVASHTIQLLGKAGRHAEAAMIAEQARARAFLDLLSTRAAVGSPAADAGRQLSSSVSAPVPTLATLEAVAARIDSTLLSYWVGDEATDIWVMGRDGRVTSHRAPVTRARLQRLVRRTWSTSGASVTERGEQESGEPTAADEPATTREPVSPAFAYVTLRGGTRGEPTGQEASALRELHDLLIKPVRAALPTRDSLVTIVPHGPLFELSFAALSDGNGRYLLEDYRLHYAPSAAALEFTGRPGRAPAAGGYLFVANPAIPKLAATPQLPLLPGAEREVQAVTRLLRKQPTTVLAGRAATEGVVRDAIGRYQVVHFATHGIVSGDQPFDSFLALAANSGSRPGDGRLTAGEIYELRLSADLVVLSACRTATGRISGDGIAGLTRAFFTAGTSSILASLWDMADESAEHLVPRFYAEWERSGDKSRALRAAQLSMIRDLKAGRLKVKTPFGEMPLPPHPTLWANLVLIGEPR